MKTLKVKPWGSGQGDFVVINESNFNPEKHKLFGQSDDSDEIAEMKAALDEAGVKYAKNAADKTIFKLYDELTAE